MQLCYKKYAGNYAGKTIDTVGKQTNSFEMRYYCFITVPLAVLELTM